MPISGWSTRTKDELVRILVDELSKILGNNITIKGLDQRPTELVEDDVLINVNLFDRLGAAYEALRALHPEYGRHPGFHKVDL